MKFLFLCVLTTLLAAAAAAQSAAALPDILKPDPAAAADAERSGTEVFKLLPRGTFKDLAGSYKDEDNPIGLREGGSFYSFTTRSHSYNQTPEIALEGGKLSVGFAGANYGFISDLGPGTLDTSFSGIEVPRFLFDYSPPRTLEEVRSEQRRSSGPAAGASAFRSRVPAVAGHVYALRAISFTAADVLVLFRVQQIEPDGSLTIAWKKVRDFDVPKIDDRSVNAGKVRSSA